MDTHSSLRVPLDVSELALHLLGVIMFGNPPGWAGKADLRVTSMGGSCIRFNVHLQEDLWATVVGERGQIPSPIECNTLHPDYDVRNENPTASNYTS